MAAKPCHTCGWFTDNGARRFCRFMESAEFKGRPPVQKSKTVLALKKYGVGCKDWEQKHPDMLP